MDIYRVGLEKADKKGQWTNINILSNASGGDGSNTKPSVFKDEFGNISLSNLSRETKSVAFHIASSIFLPMPDNLQFSYSADWSASDVNVLDSTVNGIISDKSASPGLISSLQNEITKTAASTGFRKTLKDQGLAHNPRKEMFFSGPQFRSFPLQWQLSFKSQQEAKVFDSLVATLAEHMHPEFADGVAAGTWKIPESFAITFSNAKVRKINECVLTSLQVDTNASGAGWRSFPDGSPAHVTLSLGFMEIQPLTKENIREGS